MGLFQNLPIVSFFLLLVLIISIPSSQATRIEILNNCSRTVWAAANPGGGKKLNHGETWNLTVTAYGNTTTGGRIWGRTNCAFSPDGRGKCESGDCGGLLECKIDGKSPNTVAVYLLNQTTDTDLFYVSVVEGFNIPMEFRPLSPKGAWSEASKCAEDVNGPCPMELRDPGGCNNPCTVFSNDQFCCFSGTSICEPTSYSTFFKDLCPEALTYPYDVSQSNAGAPAGTDYKVVFCPSRSRSKTRSSDTNSTGKYNTANFDIRNNCNDTVWAAAVPGGGRRLNPGQTWTINVPAGTSTARIWTRTGCSFDGAGRGRCQTGDCGGVLQCTGYGSSPNTLAEFTLNGFANLDYIDMSVIDGFNVPMEFSSTSGGCNRVIRCTADIIGQCPAELRVDGGCNGACPVFKTDQYCCNSGNCETTRYSKYFKNRCPDVYSYPKDDQTSLFTCPSGTNYQVVFCP